MNRLIASSLILLACNAVAFSEETVRRIGWEELRQAGQLLSGEIQQGEPSEPGPFLKIDNPAGTARVVPLLVVDDPAITSSLGESLLSVLNYSLPAQADGTTVKVRVQTRRNDGTEGTPSWVYSASSVVSAEADATGPTVPLRIEGTTPEEGDG